MLMNDKIIFDRYYCINSAQTKEIMVHCILQPHHIFIPVKVFTLMLVTDGLQLLIISTSFAWHPVMSKNKSHVLTISILIPGFLFITIWLLISCDMGIYAIIYENDYLSFY